MRARAAARAAAGAVQGVVRRRPLQVRKNIGTAHCCSCPRAAGARSSAPRGGLPNRQRIRRLSSQRPFSNAPRGRIPAIHTWTVTGGVAQRRHASNQPAAGEDAKDVSLFVDWQALRQTVLDTPRERFVDDLEPAWEAYKTLQWHNAVMGTLHADDLLEFASRILTFAETHKVKKSSDVPEVWAKWAARAQTVLSDTEPMLSQDDHNQRRRYWQALMTRVLALRGRIDEALALARQVISIEPEFYERRRIVAMFQTLFSALAHFRDPSDVLELVVVEWYTLGTYLESRSVVSRHKKYTVAGAIQLRQLVYGILQHLESPVRLLASLEEKWPAPWRQRAGEFLIDVYADSRHPADAVAILREVYRQKLHVPGFQQLSLVKALAKVGSFELANPMFATLERSLKDPHGQLTRTRIETGLYLFARQGDILHTQEYFRAARDEGYNDVRAVALLLHAFRVRGDAQSAVEFFDTYCVDYAGGVQLPPGRIYPTIVHYTEIIGAHAKRGDREGMNHWLERMARNGFSPDRHVYNTILKAFVDRGELTAAGAVMEQMRGAGIKPSYFEYTTLIMGLADRQDPVAAEALYKQALEEGVQPDRQMMTALLNAHVEAGSWRGVINTFDYLVNESKKRHIALSIEVYNTLLKGYVLIGAPFNVVFRLFHRLEQINIRPDAHTYSLVIQSACDSGAMGVAEKLYHGVREMSKSWEFGVNLNVYLLTILMSGFLRAKMQVKARMVYQMMIKSGISPTSVTFSSIIKAYANRRSAASIDVAMKFLNDLKAVDPSQREWAHSSSSLREGLDIIYAPLLRIYTQKRQPEEVERLLQELFDAGGEPTLVNLSALLDVYRRTGNLDGAKEVWPQIYKLGLEGSKSDALFTSGEAPPKDPFQADARRKGNILSIPLSMYIDVLSANGEHTVIANVWREMKDAGFTFDAHNWNHLCVALTRAGQPERAFEVVERVIIPFQLALRSFEEERDRHPKSPLLIDREMPQNALVRPPTNWPLHNEKRRTMTSRLIRRQKLYTNQDVARPEDFAHGLHILQQISPAWTGWRPHLVTLVTLARVLTHLQRGNLVQAIRPRTSSKGQEVAPPATLEELEERTRLAQEMLDRIVDRFPRAVDSVMRFIEWRKAHGSTMKKRRS